MRNKLVAHQCLVFISLQGPPGPIGAPGGRGEDGNPGPRVSEPVKVLS